MHFPVVSKYNQSNENQRYQNNQEYSQMQNELDNAELFGFHDDGVGVFFNQDGEPLAYDDGGDLEYDDNDNIIIFDSVTDDPLGYIFENEDGEYEFYEYEEGGDIINNSIEVTKNALSGYKKLGKKVWSLFVWPKKKKVSKQKIDNKSKLMMKRSANVVDQDRESTYRPQKRNRTRLKDE